MIEIPRKYDSTRSERKWAERWERDDLYRWDPTRPREESFVVDTPPPTVSGSLHIGHVFSYTHADLIVRYQRMHGRNIAYPIGFDDNGLPTERRVETVFGIRPNPRLPYDPDWEPRRDKPKKDPVEEISRQNFIEACKIVCVEDEKAFEDLWRRVGLSVDWSLQYATIDPHCRRLAQLSFLDLVERDLVRHDLAPTMWDIDDRTAVAQAELEDRERPGAFYDIRFDIEGEDAGTDGFAIATTRPELLGACIAVVAHPDDERYRELFGKRALTPLYRAPVPILPAEHADPEKGTGILMVCTFGDINDVDFWKAGDLPLRQLIGLDGRLLSVRYGEAPFESAEPERANATAAQIEGLTINKARAKMAELLAESGALVGEPRPITHPVKFYERGSRPLEFVTSRQWFVRLLDSKAELLEQGRKIAWHPPHMRARYDNWVEGLNQDWCVSRQRYSGVPFPVWYPLDESGEVDYERAIFASPDQLPVDPLADVPPGFGPEQRDKPGGFCGDPDVMDTWATSSLSPQLISHWTLDPERHARLFPSDLRPQSHEIIRTWAFYTIAKAWMHEGKVPWHNIAISGWILDPERKKMSKSKGNVITPEDLLEEHSADAIRYWAGRARLAVDTALDPQVFKVGRRLVTKLFNASRFVLGQLDRIGTEYALADVRNAIDADYLARLAGVVERSTAAFDDFDYAHALQASEEAFWDFCDNYVELVKARSYAEEDGPGRRSAAAALRIALDTYLRLFAPFLPYITEEIFSWRFAPEGGSIHTSSWPDAAAIRPAQSTPGSYAAAAEVVEQIRAAKTRAKKSLRQPVAALSVRAPEEALTTLRGVLDDVCSSGNLAPQACTLTAADLPEGERWQVEVTLAEGEA